jgi:hypothetical protein
VLERKPAYLDKTKLFKELKLPAAFGELRGRFTKELGERTGTRHYIRVMQLLGQHSAEQVAAAIGANLHRQVLRAEFIVEKLQPLPALALRPEDHSIVHRVTVPPPDLRRFDQLLIHPPVPQPQGDCDHAPSHSRDAAQAQSEDAAAADDAGGIQQAVA